MTDKVMGLTLATFKRRARAAFEEETTFSPPAGFDEAAKDYWANFLSPEQFADDVARGEGLA